MRVGGWVGGVGGDSVLRGATRTEIRKRTIVSLSAGDTCDLASCTVSQTPVARFLTSLEGVATAPIGGSRLPCRPRIARICLGAARPPARLRISTGPPPPERGEGVVGRAAVRSTAVGTAAGAAIAALPEKLSCTTTESMRSSRLKRLRRESPSRPSARRRRGANGWRWRVPSVRTPSHPSRAPPSSGRDRGLRGGSGQPAASAGAVQRSGCGRLGVGWSRARAGSMGLDATIRTNPSLPASDASTSNPTRSHMGPTHTVRLSLPLGDRGLICRNHRPCFVYKYPIVPALHTSH